MKPEKTMLEAERTLSAKNPVLEDSERMPLVIEVPALRNIFFKEVILLCVFLEYKIYPGNSKRAERAMYILFIAVSPEPSTLWN